MGFRRQDLQVAFSVPGTYEFTVWGYGTTDSLEEVLAPNYFQGGEILLDLGDLICVRTWPRQDPLERRKIGVRRAALVMVSGFDRGDASVRLVQDFGEPEDGAGNAAQAPSPDHRPARRPGRRVKTR